MAIKQSGHEIVVITGSGRSGTTWIQDVLAESNRRRAIFEPMKCVTRCVPAYENACLRPESAAPELERFLDTVFSGKFRSIWTDYRVVPGRLLPSPANVHSVLTLKSLIRRWQRLFKHRRKFSPNLANPLLLVKFIRANLMIEWLLARYPIKLAHILRHPGAVIESQLRLGGESWDPYQRLSYYRDSQEFMALLGDRYGAVLNRQLNPAQANTLIWCIENQYPVERAEQVGYPVFFYEDLADKGQPQQWQRICASLGLPVLPDSGILGKPSQQASKAYLKESRQGEAPQQPGWMKRLQAQEIEDIQKLLDELNFGLYEMDRPQPIRPAENLAGAL